ncbi:MAG: response regulator [Nitrospirae bacterium]|nr:response regulator [Nitrospirota bacterium]
MRVLFVDDDVSIQKLAGITLERLGGYEALICGSATEALRAVGDFRPDIIILDVNMPWMDGPQTLAEIRKLPDMSAVPVVFLTASTQQHEIDNYIRIGAAGVIAKPFDPMTLPGKIEEFWRCRERRQEERALNLSALSKDYAEGLPYKIEEIWKTWREISEGQWDDRKLEEMRLMVHNLAGSGQTFGFPEVSLSAHLLEQALKRGKALLEEENRQQVQEHIRALGAAAAAPARLQGMGDTGGTEAKKSARFAGDERLIYLVEDDLQPLQDMAMQLGYFGYTVRRLKPDELTGAVSEKIPSAVIADMALQATGKPLMEIISGINKVVPDSMPVVFISENDDLGSRLSAVRAGGEAFFTRPVDTCGLIDKLDALTGRAEEEAYRIFIVDDDTTLASRYELILRDAGMKTETASDSMKVMELLGVFRPDLILMDVYMPDSSGLELSKLIRQMASFVSIPIVFLSAETDIEKQLAAMSLGGDDFLTKPIKDSHLVSSVRSRVERSRLLHSFMVRDSLTGLLNHTKAKEQLHMAVAAAERQKSCLTYAVIDIDHFKAVNDTYGHITGDHVIKSLSRLLQQRMRKTDVIGRYGGEEFSVILAGADAEAAAAILDKIREDFNKICHQCRGIEFYVSFSCGIASFPRFGNPVDLHEAADAALYRAKKEGRNRICLAE